MKKRLKLLLILFIALAMFFSATGCFGSDDDDDDDRDERKSDRDDDEDDEEDDKDDDEEDDGGFFPRPTEQIDDEDEDEDEDDGEDEDEDEDEDDDGELAPRPTEQIDDDDDDNQTAITLSGEPALPYPKEQFANLPEPPGIIVYSYSMEGAAVVNLEGVKKSEAEDYIDTIKDSGFTMNAYSSEDSSGIYFGASYDENTFVGFSWYTDGTAIFSYYDYSEIEMENSVD